ncbi:hypothetical protein [Atopomonas sediminilitoris]|uniref:hypothetical protein n=1 Tax=Atopomonas sediminilitoris TaxID=2919919 RepID=UPI001F4E6AAD|nr:hypothetical protein [Atopomonas sediminilitoris]MCJ8170755.1 hypothetical protein [Atopomonas sediminilitoris]
MSSVSWLLYGTLACYVLIGLVGFGVACWLDRRAASKPRCDNSKACQEENQ